MATGSAKFPASRGVWLATTAAVLGSVALLVTAVTVPFYDGESVTGSATVTAGGRVRNQPTHVTHTAATLAQVNGPAALLVVALPLIASLVVAAALLRPGAGDLAGRAAWAVTALLAMLSLLAMLTVGFLALPVVACLVTACTLHQGRARNELPRPQVRRRHEPGGT